MRTLLIAAALLFPGTAFAAPRSDSPIADSLPSRGEVEYYGTALSGLIGALFSIDVGPLADAIEPGRPGAGSRQTLGDLARRDDPDFDRRLRGSAGALADNMVVLKERMRRLEPELRRSFHDIQRSLDEATRDLPDRGGYGQNY
jgi:hypothetical protein